MPWTTKPAAWMRGLLYSSRPQWAMMPDFVATNFVDNTLFLVSLLEHVGLTYTAHFGTVLGAVRLGGVCPWDEDADIYVLDTGSKDVDRRIRPLLVEHGFLLEYDARDYFWVKQAPWLAGQGNVGLSLLPPVLPLGSRPPDHPDDQRMAWDELYPLQKLRYYDTWIWGPADPERLIRRLYGESGTKETMARFRAPTIAPEVISFWARVRGGHELDWEAISHRFRMRRKKRPLRHAATWPFWWWNGAYNIGIRNLNRMGRRISAG